LCNYSEPLYKNQKEATTEIRATKLRPDEDDVVVADELVDVVEVVVAVHAPLVSVYPSMQLAALQSVP